MSAALPWAVEALIASTLLMLLVLALRGPVRRAFGPDIAYALWLLPALRLLLPPLPQGWRESVTAPVSQAGQQIVILVADPLGGGAAAPDTHVPVLGPALILLWVAGAAVFIVWHSVVHARFCRRMIAESAGEPALADGIHVIETSAAKGPLAFGIWRRYVAFPRDFAERYDADERDLALAHELGHHARGDLIANWAALIVLALHWFNPVAWRAFRAFRADQEIANDARVLAGRDAVTRHLYACAIVKAAHGGAMSAACHLHTIEDLKGRLKMLTTSRTSRARLAGGAGTIALIATLGLGLTASGTQAAERVRNRVENVTGVQLSQLTLPAAFQPSTAITTPETTTVTSVSSGSDDAPIKHRYKVLVTDDGKTVTERDMSDASASDMRGHTIQRVIVRDKSGRVITDNVSGDVPMPPMAPMAEMPPMAPQPPMVLHNVRIMTPNVPQVVNANCPGAANSPTVIHDEKHDRRIIICTNRIQRVAANGAAVAANGKDIERNAYRQALSGLRARRAQIAANTAMNDEGREGALEGLDDAIHELEGDLAAVD